MGNRNQQVHKLISESIKKGALRFTDHAVCRSYNRCFQAEDIIYSAVNGSVVEEQQDFYRAPKFIVCGRTKSGKCLKTVWAYNERNGWATLITVFSPDTNRWSKSHLRRR